MRSQRVTFCERGDGERPRLPNMHGVTANAACRGTSILAGAEQVVLERGALRIEVALRPFSFTVRRAGRRLLRAGGVWVADGDRARPLRAVHRGRRRRRGALRPPSRRAGAAWSHQRADGIEVALTLEGGRAACLGLILGADDELDARPHAATAGRCGWRSTGTAAPRSTSPASALGTAPGFDQAGAGDPARRRPSLHRSRLPARDARRRRHPAGRLRAGPVAALEPRLRGLGRRRTANGTRFDLAGERVSVSTRAAAGPLRVRSSAPTHAGGRGCGPCCRLTGFPAAAARVGLRILEEPRRLRAPGRRRWTTSTATARHEHPARRDRARLPLGDPVQHVGVQPAPVPRRRGDGRRCASAGVRTVVWVTPWVNLDSSDGQMPPDPESSGCTASRPRTTRRAPTRATSSATPAASPFVARWWMGTGLARRLHVSPTPRRGGASWPSGVLELGVEGIKADDGEGYYIPDDVRFADGRSGAEAAWDVRAASTAESMQRALDEVHPRRPGVLFGRCGWTGQQAAGILWAGDQASDFWSLRVLVASRRSPPPPPASRTGRTTSAATSAQRLVDRCPPELLLRWAAVRLLHAADAGARRASSRSRGRYDERDARALPRLRAAARAARAVRARGGGHRGALRAADHPAAVPRSIPPTRAAGPLADAYGYGPVAVGRAGARRGRPRASRSSLPARRLDRDLVGRAACAAAAR